MKLILEAIVACILVTFVGCKSVQKDVHTITTVENKNTNIITTTNKLDKSTDKSFTLGFSEGDAKVIDLLDINVSGLKTD